MLALVSMLIIISSNANASCPSSALMGAPRAFGGCNYNETSRQVAVCDSMCNCRYIVQCTKKRSNSYQMNNNQMINNNSFGSRNRQGGFRSLPSVGGGQW